MGALVAQGQPYVQLKSIKTTPKEAKAAQLSGKKCKLTTRVDFVGHAQSARTGATGTAIVLTLHTPLLRALSLSRSLRTFLSLRCVYLHSQIGKNGVAHSDCAVAVATSSAVDADFAAVAVVVDATILICPIVENNYNETNFHSLAK